MIGRFITGTVQAQEQCRQSPEYTFEEHSVIKNLLVTEYIMDIEVSLLAGAIFPWPDAIFTTPDAGCPYGRE